MPEKPARSSRSRIKLHKSVSYYAPDAINFSDLESMLGENFDGSVEGSEALSDGGSFSENITKDLEYEEMVIDMVSNLDEREKVIFLYQLLRDSGYRIDHDSCAKSLGLTRKWYMVLLGDVKMKIQLYLVGRKVYTNKGKND